MLFRLAVRTSVLAAVLLLADPWLNHARADMWSAADSMIVRLPPSAFPSLPAPIQREIEKRGCRIPQPFGTPTANVIHGQFARRGQTDWAVLCSRDGVSTILVFWNGSAARVDSLATAPDRDYLQAIGAGQIGYSRKISAIGPKDIRYLYRACTDAQPPFPLEHDGIDDYFLEKASEIHFKRRGEWVRLPGMD